MSNLSPQECVAGISRKALDAIQKNGNGDSPHAPAYISDFRETYVIETPMRKLSILESKSGEITLRDIGFIGNRTDLSLIHLEHEQAHALAEALGRIEAHDAGDAAKLPVRRVRA